MRLKALNHCKNNQIFLFIIIITKNFQGFSEKNMYFCIRNAALGNLKASFHCARLRFLCRNVWFERGKFDLTKCDGKAFLTTR